MLIKYFHLILCCLCSCHKKIKRNSTSAFENWALFLLIPLESLFLTLSKTVLGVVCASRILCTYHYPGTMRLF